ncbi:molybdopterin cofactor-binding domain-containing protein [Actinophytocola sediminis]
MNATVSFLLNGRLVTLENPPSHLLLIDYLRSPAVGLTGAPKECGPGGCGACTVILSARDADSGELTHRSVDSCLRQVRALDGHAVTTIAGTGQTVRPVPARNALATARAVAAPIVDGRRGGRNPVAHRLVITLDDALDGHPGRRTGRRPLLTGTRTFPGDRAFEALTAVPPAANRLRVGGRVWGRPATLAELVELLAEFPGGHTRLVNGNTSVGVYPEDIRAADVLIDVQLVPELRAVAVRDEWADVGAGTTYGELLELLDDIRRTRVLDEDTGVGALWFMARRTAGTIVRDTATIGGNTMLVLDHIDAGQPFPSGLLTALVAVRAEVSVRWATGDDQPERLPLAQLVDRVADDRTWLDGLVLLTYHLPLTAPPTAAVFAQKVAPRDLTAHALVNATTSLRLTNTTVADAVVVLGGIAPHPWRPARTEAALRGSTLDLAGFGRLADILRVEVGEELDSWRERLSTVPGGGVTDEYRVQLAIAFLYKAVVNALLKVAPAEVPAAERSAGVRWPGDGVRRHPVQGWTAPLAQPAIKLTAFYQATGQLTHTREAPVPARTANAAFVPSTAALANYHFRLPGTDGGPVERAELVAHLSVRWPGFLDLVTHEQLPAHGINFQGVGGDQPLLAVRRVSYVGQAVALVVADGEQEAGTIADYVAAHCLGYTEVREWPPEWRRPVLTIEQAVERGSIFPDHPTTANFNSHIWQVTRPGSDLSWVLDRSPLHREPSHTTAIVDGVECVLVSNAQSTGGQAHRYLGPQSCLVEPLAGDRWRIVPSARSPMEAHQTAAMALGIEHHRIEVDLHPAGGTTEQTRFVVGPAVVAANALHRPVRLAMPHDADTGMTGRRHAIHGAYQVAIDPTTKLLHGIDTRMLADGGAFYDCSFIVANSLQLRTDNAYRVANFRSRIDVCRTNKAPSTAFRAFGDIQGKLIIENAIDDAAYAAGLDPAEVRERNLYQRGDVTAFGQALTDCHLREVWTYLRETCQYDRRVAEVAEFNRRNRWRKRGIALLPVKYGSGYNLLQLEQAVAYLAVYASDGSVVIHQGGVELARGLDTRVVAATVLNVPVDLVRVEGRDTAVTPTPTGTYYSAEAVKQAGEQLRGRLTEFGYRMLAEKGQDWCCANQIDFWNYGKQGWATPRTNPITGTSRLIWQNLVQVAYQQRVDLVVSFTANLRGERHPVPALTFKPMDQQRDIPGIEVDREATPGGAVDSFPDFTYAAACSTVEVDILTGEVTVLRADIANDIGWSPHPAVDIAAVERAFVQGIGYVLTEDLVFQPAGGPDPADAWRYQPPAVTTIPLEFNTHLFPRGLAPEVPGNPTDALSATEVGEPPLVLATSVFLAVKDAVRTSRLERGHPGLFRLDAPATVQEVRRACAVDLS